MILDGGHYSSCSKICFFLLSVVYKLTKFHIQTANVFLVTAEKNKMKYGNWKCFLYQNGKCWLGVSQEPVDTVFTYGDHKKKTSIAYHYKGFLHFVEALGNSKTKGRWKCIWGLTKLGHSSAVKCFTSVWN